MVKWYIDNEKERCYYRYVTTKQSEKQINVTNETRDETKALDKALHKNEVRRLA